MCTGLNTAQLIGCCLCHAGLYLSASCLVSCLWCHTLLQRQGVAKGLGDWSHSEGSAVFVMCAEGPAQRPKLDENIRVLEGLAASGLRSIRYALEVSAQSCRCGLLS